MKDVVETQDYVDADEINDSEVRLQKRSGGSMMQTDMSPDNLRAEIARQTEMREIMTDYVRGQMKDDHHYYRFNDAGKPALTKDGGYLICGLFKAIPGPTTMEIIRHDDGHFTVVSYSVLFNVNGAQIASGNGSCTTRESKYAYRWSPETNLPIGFNKHDAVTREGWAFGNQLPEGFNKNTARTREVGKGERKYTQYAVIEYRVPNKDLADLENTVIKMSNKRAFVAAVQQLPLVSELFATDPGTDKEPATITTPAAKRATNTRKNNDEPTSGPSSREPYPSGGSVQAASNLAKKLKELGVEDEDLAMHFLPEGKATFADLTEEEASGIVPAMSELVNTKLSEQKKSSVV